MKKANRIVILLSTISVVLVSLLFFLSSNVNNQEKLIVIYPPTEAVFYLKNGLHSQYWKRAWLCGARLDQVKELDY